MLDTRQAPPFSVPLRFFLTAPVFGIAGAALLLFFGADALQSRWLPVTLAALHCFTAGLMLQTMLGALFQVLPVAVGSTIPRPSAVAHVVHASTASGAALLVAGFLWPGHGLLTIGGSLLTLGVGLFASTAAIGLWRTTSRNPVKLLMRAAIGGLAVTVGLGLSLAIQMEHGASALFATLFDLHALWGLGAWALALIAAVATLVVPMFYMAPRYPETRLHQFGWAGLIALGATSVFALNDMPLTAKVSMGVVAMLGLGFAVLTLDLFRRRKRPRIDASCHAWQSAMRYLAIGCALLLTRLFLAPDALSPMIEIAIGVTLVLGAYSGLIGGMQLKILPFLATLHLSPLGIWRLEGEPEEREQKWQVWSHTSAVAGLLVAVFVPVLARPAAVLLLIGQLTWASNAWRFALAYRRTRASAVQPNA